MTREEQKASEAKKYYPDDINCYYAFLHGVEWEVKHPVNVWHNASEEPQGDNYKILCVDDYDLYWVAKRAGIIGLYNNWEEHTAVLGVKMWAYVSDLLPKGGNI